MSELAKYLRENFPLDAEVYVGESSDEWGTTSYVAFDAGDVTARDGDVVILDPRAAS